MAVRIKWDEHEQAVLLCALIKVLNHELARKQAITEVSAQLRELAIAHGIAIDDKFRNENGIALQMSKLEYVFTNGKSGLHVNTGWYFTIVQIYRNDHEKYMKLLGEVMEIPTSNKADSMSFSVWIKKNKPGQADEIFASLNVLNILLLKNKTIRSSIVQITDIKEIESLLSRVRSNRGINIYFGSKRKAYVIALSEYRDYLQYLQNESSEDASTEVSANQTSEDTVLSDGGKTAEQKVLFTETPGYSYTHPVDYDDVKISYASTRADKRKAAPVQAEVKQRELKKQHTGRLSFYDWLVQTQGMAEGTGRSYDSAINTADTYAREHNIGHGMIRGTMDFIVVSETASALFQVVEFVELNQRQHNRFRAALRKYLQYIRGGGAIIKKRPAAVMKETFEDVDFTLYQEILSEKFPKGFRIESRLDMRRFRAFWKDKYGSELFEDDETVRKRIARITVRCQDFVYLPETMASEQTAQRLLAYLTECFKDGKTAVYFDALYKEFQLEFAGKHINNPDMLKRYLSFMNDGRFYICRNYLTADAKAKVNPTDEVRDYLITAGVPVTVEDLKKALSHIDGDTVFWAVAGCNSAEFVRNQKGEYFHANIVCFTQQEIDMITELIQQAIDDKDYMSGKELADAIEVKLPAIMERYPFLTCLGLRDVVAYKLQDVFSFKGKIISAYGQDLSMSDVFARFAATRDYFTLEQLNSLKWDLDTPIYFDSVYANSLRINQEEFVSRDQASFDAETTDDAISRFCTSDYIALKEISFFGSFPDAGFPWNGFLLEHYVADFSKKFKLLHIGFTAGTPVGAIVRRSSRFEDFDELVSAELAVSKIPLNRENALQYLVDIGLLARRNYRGIEQTLSRAKLQRSRKG